MMFRPAILGAIVFVAACREAKEPEIPPVTTAVPPTTFTLSDTAPRKLMTRKSDVVDTIHGEKVADPYRWLEDGDSEETKKWTDAQNAQTRDLLDVIPNRDKLHKEITELLQIGSVGAPAIRTHAKGVRYFHMRREGQQN